MLISVNEKLTNLNYFNLIPMPIKYFLLSNINYTCELIINH